MKKLSYTVFFPMDPHILAQHQVFIQQRLSTAYQQQFFEQAHLLWRFFAACLRWPAAWPSQSSLLALTGRHQPPIAHASSTSAAELRSASRPNWFPISQLSGSLCILHQLCLVLFSPLAIIGGQA